MSTAANTANKDIFWRAIKRLFGSRAGDARGSRCVTVRATLTPEKMIVAGDVTAEVPRKGGLLIRIGPDLAIAVDATDRNDSFSVRMFSTGGRVPRLVSRSTPLTTGNQQSEPPLVRLGPGGDYVRDWPEKKGLAANSANKETQVLV